MGYICVHSIIHRLPVDTWLGAIFLLAERIPFLECISVIVEDILFSIWAPRHGKFSTFLVVPGFKDNIITEINEVITLLLTIVYLSTLKGGIKQRPKICLILSNNLFKRLANYCGWVRWCIWREDIAWIGKAVLYCFLIRIRQPC